MICHLRGAIKTMGCRRGSLALALVGKPTARMVATDLRALDAYHSLLRRNNQLSFPHPSCYDNDSIFDSVQKRYFASKKTKKKGSEQQPRKLSKAEKKRREKEKQERRKWYRQEQSRKRRMKNLHPAAKMKRIIGACDYWFSPVNLPSDSFLQAELRSYQGHARLLTLASFPKLEGWTDPDIVVQALSSEAAAKRYRVLYNQRVVEAGTINRQLDILRQKEQEEVEKAQRKIRGQWRKRRIKELSRICDDMLVDLMTPIWKEDRLEFLQEEKDRLEIVVEEQRVQRAQDFDQLSATEQLSQTVNEFLTSTKNSVKNCFLSGVDTAIHDFKSEEEEELHELIHDIATIDDFDFSDELHMCYDDGDEETLIEENDAYREAREELENLEWERDNEADEKWASKRAERFMERYAGPIQDEEASNLSRDLELLGINRSEIENIDDDLEFPSPITDDASTDVRYALVKPKRINYTIWKETDNDDEETRDDDFDFEGLEDDVMIQEDVTTMSEHDEGEPLEKPKEKNLQSYSSRRSIQVIKKQGDLVKFCRALKTSLEQSPVKALGFDVEYCTLELDIRANLPAMLQLASPEPDGVVGLIWLDKFPNHGKDMVNDKAHEEFFSLLCDSTISKVGAGASQDARNLARWWGVNDPEFVSYFFSGVVDLDDEFLPLEDDSAKALTLKEMCAQVLGRFLPKRKEKNARMKKKKRKSGKRVKTSHWRTNDLTKEMKNYAADDASCSIDIWMKMLKDRQELLGTTSATEGTTTS